MWTYDRGNELVQWGCPSQRLGPRIFLKLNVFIVKGKVIWPILIHVTIPDNNITAQYDDDCFKHHNFYNTIALQPLQILNPSSYYSSHHKMPLPIKKYSESSSISLPVCCLKHHFEASCNFEIFVKFPNAQPLASLVERGERVAFPAFLSL